MLPAATSRLLNQRDPRAPAAPQAIAQARDEFQTARPSPDDDHFVRPTLFDGGRLIGFGSKHLTQRPIKLNKECMLVAELKPRFQMGR